MFNYDQKSIIYFIFNSESLIIYKYFVWMTYFGVNQKYTRESGNFVDP